MIQTPDHQAESLIVWAGTPVIDHPPADSLFPGVLQLSSPADVGPFDKSRSRPPGGFVPPPAAFPPPESSSVHRSETTVTTLPLQSRAQDWFHRGTGELRQRLYVALANASDEAIQRRAGKLAACCLSPAFYLRSDFTVSVSVIRCRDRLCPTCARSRTAKARERARAAVQRMDALRFLTLTMPHSGEPLADQLRTLRSAFTRLRKSRTWREHVTGGLATLEITFNHTSGQWHPHLHALIDGHFVPHAELREAWRLALNHAAGREWLAEGERAIVDIRATGGRSVAVQYLTKYVTKPADVSAWSDDRICEYASALSGARVLSTFGHLHGVTLDERDPNESDPASALICSMTDVQMRRRHGCPLAEAFVVLLLRVSPECTNWLHANVERASPMPDEVLNDAAGMMYVLGRLFVSHAPTEQLEPPWESHSCPAIERG